LQAAPLMASLCIHRDLRDDGEVCSVDRVAKIMSGNKLRPQIGSKHRYIKGGKVGKIADNILARDVAPDRSNQTWVSAITFVRTHEGFCM
jgi:putative transposase